MTLEQAIEHAEDTAKSAIGCECRDEYRQLAEWLKELAERRKLPEIIRCGECRFNDGTAYCVFHFRDVKNNEYCSWAERRTDDKR